MHGIMNYAGFWKRSNAYAVDSLIVLLLAWMLGLALPAAHAQSAEDIQILKDQGWIAPDTDTKALSQAIAGDDGLVNISKRDFLLPLVVSALYNILFVAGTWRATPGKRWVKLEVVGLTGERLTLLQSAVRHAASGLSMACGGLGYLTMFFRADKAALHDILCDTRVVIRRPSA